MRGVGLLLVIVVLGALITAFGGAVATAGPAEGAPIVAPSAPLAAGTEAVLIAAGDIASCENDADEETARLLDQIAGTVATLGDHVYDDGTPREFADCYDPTWGRHKARTSPAPGNHDYKTRGARGYFRYFGEAAGDPRRGYYSYDLGAWHVVALNSNCDANDDCAADSAQARWLRADLAAHPATCTLAYWHHPRFSSGEHGNAAEMEPIWQVLYDAGADVVLSGHDHLYERFAPQDARGAADPDRGITEFVVGTGGKSLYDFERAEPNSEVRNNDTFGVLKLTLHPTGYDWQFVPVAGGTFRDAGSNGCH